MIPKMRYEKSVLLTHVEAETIFGNGEPNLIARALIASSLSDTDWQWVQRQALLLLTNDSEIVVSAAIIALAHTARVNQTINLDLVLPALQAVAADTRYRGKVADALDDIQMFVPDNS